MLKWNDWVERMNSTPNWIYISILIVIVLLFGYKVFGEEDNGSWDKVEALQESLARLNLHNNMKQDECNQEAKQKETDAFLRKAYADKCFNEKKLDDLDLKRQLKELTNTWTVSTAKSVLPSWSYQCSIGTGSHDVRQYAKFHPWIAWWRNNNTSWITMGSTALQNEFDRQGIQWEKGTLRPANEWNRYYAFQDLENGMRAKLLIIKRSYKDSTISQFLARWWTDSIPTTLDKNRKIGSLSDSELLSFLRLQIQKESGKAFADYVYENVIICS